MIRSLGKRFTLRPIVGKFVRFRMKNKTWNCNGHDIIFDQNNKFSIINAAGLVNVCLNKLNGQADWCVLWKMSKL